MVSAIGFTKRDSPNLAICCAADAACLLWPSVRRMCNLHMRLGTTTLTNAARRRRVVSSPDDVISERRRVERVARRITGEFGTSRA
jgi:hypothetical protein